MQRRTVLKGAAAGTVLAATGVPTAQATPGLRSGYATVNGVRLHYVTAGAGDPVVLLPGWPRTWWEYHKVIPALATTHRVIAVDIRGMGDSAKPEGGYDKKTMAADIAALVRRLGHDTADVVGSDIGAMVAFSVAANHPDVVRTVTLLDVPHPEASWRDFRLLPQPGQPFFLWWFAFNQVRGLPERLLAGQARDLVDYLCDLMLVNPDAVTDRDRARYAAAYDTRDAIRAGNGWYQAFGQDIADDGTYAPVTAPLLALANPAQYDYLRQLMPTKAKRQQVIQIENTGHYLVEEQPDTVLRHLTEHLTQPS